MYTDSHAHLGDLDDLDAILERASQAGVSTIINICTNLATLERGLLIAKKYPWIHCSASTTPHDVTTDGESVFPVVAACARRKDLVAIGETGLDYHYEHSPKSLQQEFLVRYLHLALECQLPVIIHCRDAFADFFEIIDREYQGAPFLLHCFTGTLEEACGVIERGGFISISGIVTFKKSEELRHIVKEIPLERLLIETDAPYLAPQSKRGKINEPSYILETAACIAGVKGVFIEAVATATTANAKRLIPLAK